MSCRNSTIIFNHIKFKNVSNGKLTQRNLDTTRKQAVKRNEVTPMIGKTASRSKV